MRSFFKFIAIVMLSFLCIPSITCINAIIDEEKRPNEKKNLSYSSNNAFPNNDGPPGKKQIESAAETDSVKKSSTNELSLKSKYLNTLLNRSLDPPLCIMTHFIDKTLFKKEVYKKGGGKNKPLIIQHKVKVIRKKKYKKHKRKGK